MTTDGHSVPRTGNGFIDASHHSLMEQVGTIRQACADGASRDAVVPHFDSFVDEMRAHFSHEEVIIRAAGYNLWEEHAHQHAMLDQQFVRLIDYVRECEVSPDFVCTVAGTLDAVLCRHEIRSDVDYAGLVREASGPIEGKTLIVWDAEFETGVESLDAQHRQLADCLNELYRMSLGGASGAEAMALLEATTDHVHAHFAMEEGMLRARSPGRFLAHHAYHRELEAQFARIRKDIEGERIDLGVAVRDFLRFWLMDHVLGADRPAFAVPV